LDRADSEESLYTFFRAAWPYIDPAPWMDGWCMEAIADHLQAVCDGDIKRLLINISPRCSKSSLVSVAFPAWVWAQPRVGPISGPTVPFLHASYANQLSLRDSVKCRRLIESPWYQERWGNRFQLTSDQNTKSRFTNDKGGERLITSIDGTNTGEGGMCFIAGTLVSTPSGDRRIEEMKVGDPVFAFDVQRGKVVISKVLATSRRKTNDLCTLHEVSGHRFTCTSNHPIYSPGRRFIKAGELGQGDRLLIAGEKRATDTDDSAFDLRKLWEENTKTPISATQGAHAEQQRRLLRQCVQVAAPRIQKFHKYLSHVFQAVIKSAWAVLFDGLQADRKRTSHNGAASHAPGETLRILQKRISAAEQESFLLLCQMLQRSAFSANDWIWKFQVSREWGLFESLHGDALGGERERPQSLRDLPRERENLHQAQEEDLIGGASHRRKTEKQCAAELDYVVRAVPSQSPLWHFGRVAEVQCHRDQEVEVYDIQVEGQNNFFAESILVHNCIIIDDPNSVDDVDSEATIQTAIDWWEGTMPTRLNNQETGAYIIIQQRTFENDLTGHILETEGADWVHLMIPMRYEPDRSFFSPIGWKDPRTVEGELMWPERFSEAATKRLEKRLGSFRTAGQLQQRPEPAGGGIIRRAWWQLWEGESFPPFDFIVGLLDTAFTEL
jgi:hypothetical protein